MKIITLSAAPRMIYGRPGYISAAAAADAINKILADSGNASFPETDRLAENTAIRSMQREIDSCAPDIAADLTVNRIVNTIEE